MRSVAALALLLSMWHTDLAVAVQEPHVVIRSPQNGSFVSDRVTLDAQVEPTALAARSSHAFFVDGREVCRTEPPAPASCEWDAGALVKPHVVRVVTTLEDGRRLVATIRTQGLDAEDSAVVRIVRVTAVVTSRSGAFVPALPKEVFRIREDGTPQAILHFSGSGAPMEVALVVDISASMAAALPELRRAVSDLVALLPATAMLSIMAFNDDHYMLLRRGEPSRRGLAALDRLRVSGGTALHDAIIRGLDQVSGGVGRRALIVFTDGDDRSSRATAAHVQRAIEGSDATVYFVALGRGREVEDLLAKMRRLSALSGGRALQAEDAGRLSERFGEIVDELSHQYLLGYEPTNSVFGGQWRSIEVDTSHREFRVRARPGYRATPTLKP